MWIATTLGFYSAVQESTRDEDLLSIRGRSIKDLEALAQWLHDERGYQVGTDMYPTIKSLVVTDIGRPSDYPARVFVWRQDWAAFVMDQAMKIDYTNFKSAVMRRQGWQREKIYHDVWAALRKITNESRLKRAAWYDERPGKSVQVPSGTLMDMIGTGQSTLDLGDVDPGWAAGLPAGESDRRCDACGKFADQCPNDGRCAEVEADLAEFEADLAQVRRQVEKEPPA